MDVGLVAVLVALLSVPIASLFTWTLNKRKDVAQIANLYSEAGQNAVDSISTALEAVKDQLNEVQRENQQLHIDLCDLKSQNEQLLEENKELRADLLALKQQNIKLMEQIHDMRVSYEQLSQNDN